MAADPLKTLFYPFEAGALPLPRKDARVLFLGAEPGFRLPAGFEAPLHLVQGFRPHFRALQASGHTVTARADGSGFDIALVLAGRHRGQNELRIAEAIERVGSNGLIVVAGGKDDGIDSLRKRVAALLPVEGHTFPSPLPSRALDFVFVPQGCRVTHSSVVRSFLSDHRPVVVDFHFD